MRAIVTAFAVLAAYGGAGAQGYPEKQVVVVVPFPAGGATDPVARALTQRMSEIWKQPVIVLNRAGAGGNIGSESVARSAPDGYTLLFGTTSLAIGPSLYAKLSFDVLKDFATISQASIAPNILVVHPSLPARSVRELVALAKARPGQLISASAGTGTSNHLSLVQFVSLAKVDITHVPYKGAAPAVVDIVGGHAHMTFAPAPATLALVQAGRLRALGVTTPARFSALPDIPAIAETVPGYDLTSWVGFLAPAATPRAVVMRIHATLLEALRTPAVKDALVKSGSEPLGNTPEEFAENLKRELPKWNRIIKEAGIKLD
ncbi:MAG TPA: tripartite tricarboxylate transporter substrate binding protein [Burkholderiales bacterium]|nr:tripartite tricarboxylate transporter substrate binding protein [Burkholderiales bacterium]